MKWRKTESVCLNIKDSVYYTLCQGKVTSVFEPLAKIAELLSSGIGAFSEYRSKKEREEAVIQIMEVYFLIKDCVDEGERLLRSCEWNPVGKIRLLPPNEAEVTAKEWDRVIRRQGVRLYVLQGYILADHKLSIIDPNLQDKLSKVIGYKMDRMVTLHGIGSALYFNVVLPTADTPEEKAELVAYMVGAEKDDPLDMDKISAEMASLRDALTDYRKVVEHLVTEEELVALSAEARERANALRA